MGIPVILANVIYCARVTKKQNGTYFVLITSVKIANDSRNICENTL